MGNEQFCEVVSRGQVMRGFVHRPPQSPAQQLFPAVLLLHGLTGTHIEPHRFFVSAARHLASEGIMAARFDFIGSGNSDGEFVDMTPDTEIEDTLTLLSWLREQEGVDAARLGLLGFSMGGLVATCAAARADVQALCLWAGSAHMYQRMKEQATLKSSTKMKLRGWHDMGGNKTGRAFFESAARLRPLEAAQQFRGKVLIVHGSDDTVVPVEDARDYAAAFAACSPQLQILPGADHSFNRVEWAQTVIDTTSDFLKKNL